MKSHYSAGVFLALLFTLLAPTGGRAETCTQVILSGSPNFPPAVWSDYREIHGAARELLQTALEKHGIEVITDHVGGNRRVIKALQEGRIHIALGIPKSESTRNSAYFLKEPLYQHSVTVLVQRHRQVTPNSWDDLKTLKGAMPNELSINTIFTPDSQPQTLMRTFTPRLALKMLAIGRVDYTIYPSIQEDLFVSLLNMEGKLKKIPLTSKKIPVYAAVSQASNCSLPLTQIENTLRDIKASGLAERIINDSLYKWMNYQLQLRDAGKLSP